MAHVELLCGITLAYWPHHPVAPQPKQGSGTRITTRGLWHRIAAGQQTNLSQHKVAPWAAGVQGGRGREDENVLKSQKFLNWANQTAQHAEFATTTAPLCVTEMALSAATSLRREAALPGQAVCWYQLCGESLSASDISRASTVSPFTGVVVCFSSLLLLKFFILLPKRFCKSCPPPLIC